jgi:hypothetical protein
MGQSKIRDRMKQFGRETSLFSKNKISIFRTAKLAR